ncbi:MAG: hypothetical protein WBA39_15280 [Rivularia sp. (in: cyanobacteria)]
MFDNKKTVVSGIVALSGTFITPDTAQASLNRSKLNLLMKTTQNSTAAKQAADSLNKVKASKKNLDFVKADVVKAINKAKNIRNDALKKVNQAEELAEAAKEDWNTKLIIAVKKLQQVENNLGKTYLIKHVMQAKENAEKAKENFEIKKLEVAKKRLYLKECEENLEAAIEMQNNRIQSAEMACKVAQVEQQKAICFAA